MVLKGIVNKLKNDRTPKNKLLDNEHWKKQKAALQTRSFNKLSYKPWKKEHPLLTEKLWIIGIEEKLNDK